MIGENRPMTFSYHIDYKLGSTVKTATGSNEDLLLQVRESDHRLQVTLHPTAPIQVRSFILELTILFTPDTRFMANGFQSWTDSREVGPTERMPGLGTVGNSPIGRRLGMQYTGDYTFVPEEKQAGVFHSHGFAYVRTGDMLDFIGSLTDRTGFTVITADMNRNVLAVSKDLEGLMLTEDYPVLDLYMQQGHYDAVFDGYFAALGVHPRQTEKLRGYTSWYNYYSNINHNIIMHDLRAIAPCAGVNTFQVDDGYQTAVLESVRKAGKEFITAQAIPVENLSGIGVSATGQIDSRRGVVAGTCGNFPGWIGVDIKGTLEREFDLPVTVANDANCMLLGEVWVGAAKGYTDVIGVTLGTGVGGGILTGGRLLEGARGLGGELGHFRLHALDGVACTCGAIGGYERYAATTALVRDAQKMGLDAPDGRAIFEAAAAGDARTLAVLNRWISEIAQGLAGLVHIFNPQLILIGGGVRAQQALLIDPLAAQVRKSIMPAFAEGLEVRAAALQNDAGLVGAVYYFKQQ